MIALVPLVAAAAVAAPTLTDVRVETGSHPFAGDHRLLATVSPNGDGFRDRAIVRFRLDKPARVRLDVLRTDTIHLGKVREQVVWRTQRRLGAGRGQLAWRPARSTPPRTYVLRLTAAGAAAGASSTTRVPARTGRPSSGSRASWPASRSAATRPASPPR